MKTTSKSLLFAAALVAIAVKLMFTLQAAQGGDLAVTYTGGTVRAAIPYRGLHAGAGKLTVEVLDPEDGVVGRAEQRVEIAEGGGTWHAEIAEAKKLAVADLVWHRLRYSFTYANENAAAARGTESISEILRTPVVHILGQQAYLTGGAAAVRVIVTDSKNEVIAGNGSVRIELVDVGERPQALYTGRLNARGTTEAQFRFPGGVAGNHVLRYVVDTPIGSTEYTQNVRLEEKAAILLTTEKPIYQPGQTIHVRALALDRANHEATAERKLTLEVEDSRGNKVFKKLTQTDKFGVAAAEFGLAEEVNLGTYHVRALMDAGNSAEIALNVERYVLPKFKVALEFAGKDQQAKRGYRPGDHVTGTVRANYFFGKAVDGAEISVKGAAMDVAMREAGSAGGHTDKDGEYKFDLQLPGYFAGLPLNHGTARVLIEATVKDGAGHAETRGEPITVSESPLIVTAVPEGGTLVPTLENQVFVLVSYPDGTPAEAELKIHAGGNADQTAKTDAGGVAVVRVKAGVETRALKVSANDREGNHVTSSVPLELRQGADQILLRTERAVYRAGDRIALKVFSTRERGTAYIDVVKSGQTVMTRDLELANGQAELSVPVTADLAGTVDFSAYLFGRDAIPVGDHRLVFVQPADELKIEATADATVYRPGSEARIGFRVTNSKGEGVSAALGLQIVDEAVFALAEKKPGFAKVFFYLEQEAMKPRYEIHSIGMPDIVEPVPVAKVEQRDRAARALFAATESVRGNQFTTEFGRDIPRTKFADYAARYRTRFDANVQKVAEQLTSAYRERRNGADLTKTDLRDSWGNGLRVERLTWDPQRRYFVVRSAGPDKRYDTGDDLMAYLEVRTMKVAGPPSAEELSFDVQIEHDRGANNGFAVVTGTITDTSGATVAGATITARNTATEATRTARSTGAGEFSLAGLAPGSYELRVSSPGFRIAARTVTLKERDRAVVSVVLSIGNVMETVEVTAAAPMIMTARAMTGVGRGVMGGVPGGVRQLAAPMAMMAEDRRDMALFEKASNSATVLKKEKDSVGGAAPHVRSWFPEALYINPEIVTDRDGRASIVVPIADSITTWRMAMIASTTRGALGSGTGSVKVFQDFFVDLDMPVTLTQGDRVTIPVAAYNYSGKAGDVGLELQAADWYGLVEDVPAKTIAVESGKVGGAQFTVEAKRIGKFKLTLSARMAGGTRADIVVREIEVVPNGRERNAVFNGRLESTVRHEVTFPPTAIADAGKVFVRLYPGPLSQVIEGMDSILRMPGGCFEQTSSSTYPNVLALDYMKRTKKLTPEVHAKAEGYIANGYQRLLTFEVAGGGFSWFGNPPANKILTSYGLMEFFDMSKVYDVDPKVILRTQQWLAGQQQADGSWKPDTNFINEGATNRYNSDVLRITAYIAWALGNTGYSGPSVEKARQYVEAHMGGKLDTYTSAVIANFAADYAKDRAFTNRAMQALVDARTEKDEQAWWTSEETGVFAHGASASVETTGLAAQALLKWGQASGTVAKAMSYIASKKDAQGTWGTTQATIMALRALLLSTEKSASDVRGTVEITLNGRTAETLTLTADNNDLLHQFVLKGVDSRGANEVGLRFTGKGGLAYQVVGRYFTPWEEKAEREPMSITVDYDRTRLAQDDIATATATVRNQLGKVANMVMVDLGIPPGFDLLSEDLQAMQEKTAGRKGGRLEKFQMTATQAILYFDSVGAGQTVTVKFRLRAKYPIRVKTFQSRVYEYYDPDVNAVARPVQMEVRKK
jgi:uncharacterized protein YfaS (alpha-2-macroglobulin family)